MKKIRVSVSENMWALLQKDSEEFGINNNKLCNYILNHLKYSREIEFDKELDRENREFSRIVQFDLNVANEKIYYDILRENKVQVEAEFIRELFKVYANNIKYQRELFVFQERVQEILQGIKKELKLKVKYEDEVYIVYPYFLKREDQGDENYLFLYNETLEKYENLKLKELEVIGVLRESIPFKDEKLIEKVRDNFDPFLQEHVEIKVKLTLKGESLLKSLTNYRPQIIKKDKNIYTFKSSLENGELYFWELGSEVEILEPTILKERIKKKAQDILELYKM